MLHFRNDERTFLTGKFRTKFFLIKGIKMLWLKFWKRLLGLEIPSKRYNNLIKEDETLYSLKDDLCITLATTFSQKFISAYMTYQLNQSFQTAAFTLKVYLHFWTIWNHLLRGLNFILRTLIIFLIKMKRLDSYQRKWFFVLWTLFFLTPTYHMGNVLAISLSFWKLRIAKNSSG